MWGRRGHSRFQVVGPHGRPRGRGGRLYPLPGERAYVFNVQRLCINILVRGAVGRMECALQACASKLKVGGARASIWKSPWGDAHSNPGFPPPPPFPLILRVCAANGAPISPPYTHGGASISSPYIQTRGLIWQACPAPRALISPSSAEKLISAPYGLHIRPI